MEARFEIAKDDEFDAEFFADAGAVGEDVAEQGKFDHDDLRDAPLGESAFDVVEAAKDFDPSDRGGSGIVAENSNRGVADVFFAFDPALQERNFFAGTD